MKKRLELKEIDALRATKLAFVLSAVITFLSLGAIWLKHGLRISQALDPQVSSDLGKEIVSKYTDEAYTISVQSALMQFAVCWISVLVVCFVYNILARKVGGLIFVVEES